MNDLITIILLLLVGGYVGHNIAKKRTVKPIKSEKPTKEEVDEAAKQDPHDLLDRFNDAIDNSGDGSMGSAE